MSAALGYAAITGVSSLLGSSAKRRQRRREKRAADTKYGIEVAGKDFTSARIASFIPSQAKAIADQELINTAEVEKKQAQVEADMRVSAAAAGVSGGSVELSLMDTERTLYEAKSAITKNREDEIRQLQISTTDRAINTELGKGIRVDNEKSSKSSDLLLGGLDFLQAYISKI